MAFTAGVGWRRQGWTDDNPVSGYLANMWVVFQPLLFSLIGAEIQVIIIVRITNITTRIKIITCH